MREGRSEMADADCAIIAVYISIFQTFDCFGSSRGYVRGVGESHIVIDMWREII
jgi:hypothetical protein